MRAVALAVVAAFAVLAHARTAAAGELVLTWTAPPPPACPTTTELRDAVLRGGTGEPKERIEAVARVEHGERWSVTLQTTRAGVVAAERHLEADSCRALADALTVILALAVIPEAAAAPDSEKAPPPRETIVAPVAPLVAASGADHGTTTGEHPVAHGFAASASLATDASTLPAPGVGARGALAWTPGAGRVELAGSYFTAQSRTTGLSAAGASFTSGVVGARASWAVLQSAVELAPRVGADVELLRARGFGAADNYDASAAWLSVAGGGLVVVPVASWLALRAEADAIVPLSRPRFVVDGEGAIHRPAPIGLRAGIGAELRFL